MMQGLLTDAAWTTSADTVPAYRARTRHFAGTRPKSRLGEAGHEALLFDTLSKLRAISAEAEIPLADLALAFPLTNPAVACVIAGATKQSQLEASARAARLRLDPRLLEKLLAPTDELKIAMGTNCDLWQGLHADGRFDGRIKWGPWARVRGVQGCEGCTKAWELEMGWEARCLRCEVRHMCLPVTKSNVHGSVSRGRFHTIKKTRRERSYDQKDSA